MPTTKTAQEILARIKSVENADWMGTQRSDLIGYLPFEDAKAFLKPEATQEEWDARTVTDPLEAIKDYLPFAWDKANDCRGLSAGRSLDHMKAWLWLAGFEPVLPYFDDYEHYGKTQLIVASELVGFDWKAHDSGDWVNDESGPSISADRIASEAARAKAIADEALAGTPT